MTTPSHIVVGPHLRSAANAAEAEVYFPTGRLYASHSETWGVVMLVSSLRNQGLQPESNGSKSETESERGRNENGNKTD